MEHSVQLGTLRYHDSICECLRELSRDEGLPLQISDVQQGRRWLIQCKFLTNSREAAEDEEIVGKIHLYYLANALAEFMNSPGKYPFPMLLSMPKESMNINLIIFF